MARFHTTLLLPGNEITAMTEVMGEGRVEGRGASEFLGGPYEGRFENSFMIRVGVVNTSPPSIHAALYSQTSQLLEEREFEAPLDQDYAFESEGSTYQLTILRAANTVITAEEVVVYRQNNGTRCPFCGSDDLHGGKIVTVEGRRASQRVECCSCEARWKAVYRLVGVDRDPDSWEPPQVNVRRAT